MVKAKPSSGGRTLTGSSLFLEPSQLPLGFSSFCWKDGKMLKDDEEAILSPSVNLDTDSLPDASVSDPLGASQDQWLSDVDPDGSRYSQPLDGYAKFWFRHCSVSHRKKIIKISEPPEGEENWTPPTGLHTGSLKSMSRMRTRANLQMGRCSRRSCPRAVGQPHSYSASDSLRSCLCL